MIGLHVQRADIPALQCRLLMSFRPNDRAASKAVWVYTRFVPPVPKTVGHRHREINGAKRLEEAYSISPSAALGYRRDTNRV